MKYHDWHGIVLLGLLASPALAANKCIEGSGRIFYQAAPCPVNTRGGDMRLNINQPFTGEAKHSTPASEPAVKTERQDSAPGHERQSGQQQLDEDRAPQSKAIKE